MSKKKILLLGIDGLDFSLTEKLLNDNLLPNLSSLKNQGIFSKLDTLNPAQSPVIWSSIATGKNPGHHGIFDFIKRNPANYLPELSITQFNKLNLLGSKKNMFLPVIKTDPFWKITSRNNIPTTVIRWPLTLPIDEIKGNMLAGLGVPDLKGTLGRYSFYTTDKNLKIDKGDLIIVPGNSLVETEITGPDKSSLPLKIKIESDYLEIFIKDEKYILKEKKWSEWINIEFDLGPFRKVSSISKFYLDSIKPHLKLFMLPLQCDPSNPVFQISSPISYSDKLAQTIGLFATLGIPEDTNALSDNVISVDSFLQLCDDILEEKEKMLFYELKNFKEGILAFVIDTLDRIQHIFYKINKRKIDEKYSNIVFEYYKKIDTLLGKIINFIDKDTIIMIFSDHGFSYFDKAVHLNRWLIENNLMTLKNKSEEGKALFEDVLWDNTQAYALGFSSIYINLQGREGKGIVKESELNLLKTKIASSLKQLKDPETKENIVENVYQKEEIFEGPYLKEAPDLIVGFRPGYRMSWQTAIGGSPLNLLEENNKPWCSDHIVDAKFVPGVFFINKKIDLPSSLNVLNISPLLFKLIGI